MSPPQDFYDFMLKGYSDRELGRRALENASFHGNEAIWIILPPKGEIVGRLDTKIYSYRIKPGHLRYEARRLDARGTVPRQPVAGSDYGDIGFQPGGVTLPEKGCWEVTYLLDTGGELRFVLRVR